MSAWARFHAELQQRVSHWHACELTVLDAIRNEEMHDRGRIG